VILTAKMAVLLFQRAPGLPSAERGQKKDRVDPAGRDRLGPPFCPPRRQSRRRGALCLCDLQPGAAASYALTLYKTRANRDGKGTARSLIVSNSPAEQQIPARSDSSAPFLKAALVAVRPQRRRAWSISKSLSAKEKTRDQRMLPESNTRG